MEAINYAYLAGALEGFLNTLHYDSNFNRLTDEERKVYIQEHIERMKKDAIEYGNLTNGLK